MDARSHASVVDVTTTICLICLEASGYRGHGRVQSTLASLPLCKTDARAHAPVVDVTATICLIRLDASVYRGHGRVQSTLVSLPRARTRLWRSSWTKLRKDAEPRRAKSPADSRVTFPMSNQGRAVSRCFLTYKAQLRVPSCLTPEVRSSFPQRKGLRCLHPFLCVLPLLAHLRYQKSKIARALGRGAWTLNAPGRLHAPRRCCWDVHGVLAYY